MTIKDLYDWAIENGVEDYDLMCAYADGGGFYSGSRSSCLGDIEIDHSRKEVTI